MNDKLKWYNYIAKVILMGLLIPAAPILVLIALAAGQHPFEMYKSVWNID